MNFIYRKVALAVLMVVAAAGAVPASYAGDTSLSTATIARVYRKLSAEPTPICKRALRGALAWKIRARALRLLPSMEAQGSVGDAAAEAAVRQALREADFLPRQWAGGVALSGMILFSYKFFSDLPDWLHASPNSTAAKVVPSIGLGIALMLLSRFSDPIWAATKRFTLTVLPPTPSGPETPKPPSDPEFWQIYQQMQHDLNMNEQMARNCVNSYLINLNNHLDRALRPVGNTPEKQRRYTVDQLTLAALLTGRLFKELNGASKFILVPFRAGFRDHYEALEGLADEVLEDVLKREVDPGNPAVQAYYRGLMDIWFR